MNVLFVLLLLSLTLGQVVSVSIGQGIFLYAQDFVLPLFLIIGFASIGKKRRLVVPKLMLPISVFAGVSIVSLLLNIPQFGVVGILQSSLYLVRWVMYALVYILLSQRIIEDDFLLWGLYAYGGIICLLGFIQFLFYPDLRLLMYLGWDPHYYRLFSTLFDPNFAGILITMTIFLGLWLYEKTKHLWLWISILLNGVALYLTYSRSSYLAFVAGFLVWILYKRKWIIGALALVCLILILAIPRPGGKTLALLRADSTLARLGNWKESVGIIASAPIIGHGFNTLRLLHDERITILNNSFVSHAAAGLDSSLLFVMATTGIVGFGMYGWFIFEIVARFWRKTWLMSTILSSLITHSFFVNSMFYAWVMLWVWVLIAALEVKYL